MCILFCNIFHPYHLSLINVCNNHSNSWGKKWSEILRINYLSEHGLKLQYIIVLHSFFI